jgi:2-iminobutanoate/2-iminopropanoate deaminase
VLDSLKYILEEAGVTLNDVCRTTILLSDISDFSTVNSIYAEYFKSDSESSPPPSRVTYAVQDLPLGTKIEIEAIALLNEHRDL